MFTPAVNIARVRLVDIDQDETGGAVCVTHGVGKVVHTHGMQALGDNSGQWVSLWEPNVIQLDVKFPSSGAIADLEFFCPDP